MVWFLIVYILSGLVVASKAKTVSGNVVAWVPLLNTSIILVAMWIAFMSQVGSND